MKVTYDAQVDVLRIILSDQPVDESDEDKPGIIIDLPDPNDHSLGKLYSKEFYELLKKRLAADGVLVTQSSSPYLARKAFWSVNKTLEAVFDSVLPYHVYIPSFGPGDLTLRQLAI